MRFNEWIRTQPRLRLAAVTWVAAVFVWFMPHRGDQWTQPFVVLWLITVSQIALLTWNGLYAIDTRRPLKDRALNVVLNVPLGYAGTYMYDQIGRDPTWFPGRSLLASFGIFAPYVPAYLALLAAVAGLGWYQRRKRRR